MSGRHPGRYRNGAGRARTRGGHHQHLHHRPGSRGGAGRGGGGRHQQRPRPYRGRHHLYPLLHRLPAASHCGVGERVSSRRRRSSAHGRSGPGDGCCRVRVVRRRVRRAVVLPADGPVHTHLRHRRSAASLRRSDPRQPRLLRLRRLRRWRQRQGERARGGARRIRRRSPRRSGRRTTGRRGHRVLGRRHRRP